MESRHAHYTFFLKYTLFADFVCAEECSPILFWSDFSIITFHFICTLYEFNSLLAYLCYTHPPVIVLVPH